MAQEEVTKQAPKIYEVEGYEKNNDSSSEANDGSNQEQTQEQIEKQNKEYLEVGNEVIDSLGYNVIDLRSNLQTSLARQSPTEATGLEEGYAFEGKEYEQGFWADAGAGLYNGLVIGGGEGLANLVPTVAQALGSKNEFINAWSENVTSFFDNQKMLYSDSADEEINQFGDINSTHVARALGQGVGFLVGIIGTGGVAGGLSKAGKALSKYNKIVKGLQAAEKSAKGAAKVAAAARLANFTSKAGKIAAKADKGAQWASRVGTFMAGTTLMYPEIQKEAKKAGLSNSAAARFALGVSGIVSLTEGAALEWIGKVASKPLTSALTKSTVKEVLKSGTNPTSLIKAFTTNYTSKISKGALKNVFTKPRLGSIVEGAAIEFGQEFSQTYIEEGAKNLYDVIYEGENKGNFGADVTTYKQFVESVFGGLIGGVLGGFMGGIQTPSGLGNELNDEGLFGYVNNSIVQNKTDRIDKLNSSIQELISSKKMTKSEGAKALELISDLKVFAENVKTSDIEDNVAKFQLYQLDKSIRNTDKAIGQIKEGATSNPKLNLEAKKKKQMLESVKQALTDNFAKIYDSKKQETDSKGNKRKLQKKGITGQYSLFEKIEEAPNDKTTSGKIDLSNLTSPLNRDNIELPVSKEEEVKEVEEVEEVEEVKEVEKVEEVDNIQEEKEIQEEEEEVEEKSNNVTKDFFDNKIEMYNDLIIDILNGKILEQDLPKKLFDIDSSTKLDAVEDSENFVINEVAVPISIAENLEAIKDIRDNFQLVDENKKTSEEYFKEMKEKYGLNEDQLSQIINENFEKQYELFKNKDKNKDKDKTKIKTKKEVLDKKIKEAVAEIKLDSTPRNSENWVITLDHSDFPELKGVKWSYSQGAPLKDAFGNDLNFKGSLKDYVKQKYTTTKTDTTTKPKVETTTDTTTKPKVDTKADTTTDTKAEPTTTKPKVDTKADTTAEPKVDTKTDTTAEAKIDTITDIEVADETENSVLSEEIVTVLTKDQQEDSFLESLNKENTTTPVANTTNNSDIEAKRKGEDDRSKYPGIVELIKVYSGGKLFFGIDAKGLEIAESLSANGVTADDIFNIRNTIGGKIGDWFKRGFENITGKTYEEYESELYGTDTAVKTTADTKPYLVGPKRSIGLISDISKNSFSNENDTDNTYIVVENSDGNYEVFFNEKSNKDVSIFALNNPRIFFDGFNKPSSTQGMKGAVMVSPAIVNKKGDVIVSGEIKYKNSKGFENNFRDSVPFQKRRFAEQDNTNETIAENPDLFNYIKSVLKKAFPNVTVNMINSMLEKYGVDALASVYKNAVDIQRDSAVQTSIIHEFAHIYVDMLGRDHPLVKAGLKLIEGTEMHKKAISEYPESEGYSKEDQLMEALIESIAIKNLNTLRTNFEGTTFDKFIAYAKRLWSRIKGIFNNKYYNEIDTIARKMIDSSVKDKNGVSSRLQFQKNISPKFSELINTVQKSISQLRMYAVRNPDIDYDDRNVQMKEAYGELLKRYKEEKDPNSVILNPIFENITLEEESILNLYNSIKENDPEYHKFILKAVDSVTKKTQKGTEEGSPNETFDSSNPIKTNKGFSPSVKSMLSALVDNDGNAIDTNEVFRFVATIANTSLNGEDFFRRIKERKEKNSNSIISDRVYNMLNTMAPKDRQLLIFEMSNAVQTPFSKFAFLQNYKNNNDSVGNKLFIRQLNKDYEAGITAGVYLKNIKTFSDQDALKVKEKLFGKNAYPNSTLGNLISSRGHFGEKFAKYKSVTNDNRKKYNELISTLLGEEVPLSYTDKIIDDNKTTDKRTKAQNLISRIYSQTNTDNESKPLPKTGIDSYLGKIAQEVEGSQSLINSFLNSRGERVSTTGLGHSMTDVIKRYRDDIASPQRLQEAKNNYRDLVENNASTQEISDASNLINDINDALETKKKYKESPVYKNNTVLKRADKNKGVINNFIADAIDNNGNVRELSLQTKDDVMITQAMGFANTNSSDYYMQQYGIQGDRPNTRFFEVPRYSENSLKQAYQELKETDEYLFKKFSEDSKKRNGENTQDYKDSISNYVKVYNDSTLNFMNEDGSIETPYENNARKAEVKRSVRNLKRALSKANLTKKVIEDENGDITEIPSVIGSDLVGENKIYKTENDLLTNFVYNESLHRTHLNNLFQGPVVHRKSVEDHIKRALGTNSTGNLINVDKPVVTLVVRALSKTVKEENKKDGIPTSDSFSINGERLHSHIAKQIGGQDRLGANMKDLLFQIDPYSGDMTFLKMSTLGVIGDKSNNNFMEMGPSTDGRTGYNELAKISFALEELIGEGKYLKIIDEKAIKGNEGKNVTPIDIDSLLNVSENKNELQKIINNNSFELKYTGYRTPFKMNKDLSKIPLDKQAVVASGQMMKIALNTGHSEDVQKLEGNVVELLKRQLGIDKGKGYTDSKIYKNLLEKETLLNGVLTGTEESGKESISNVLLSIINNNAALKEKASEFVRLYTAAEKNNPNVQERSDEVVKVIKENKNKAEEIFKDLITALDHPNIKAQIEQYIGSKMGRTGARPEIPGNYLQMLPDYGNTLKSPKLIKVPIKNKIKHNKKIKRNQTKLDRLREIDSSPDIIQKQEAYLAKLKEEKRLGIKEVLTDLQVAVPWSTFGSTREEAEAFIKSRKDEGRPVKVVVVRVPASIGVSTFGADVSYLTDGKANTVITPDEFIKMSDADHDGDKAFVYREDLKTEKNEETGESKTQEVKGIKSKLFWNLYTQLTSDEIREQHSEDLTTDNIEKIVKKINEKKSVKNTTYKLRTFEQLADLLSKYSFGAKAIGIEAVAGKMLSMFTQSNIELNNPIVFDGKEYKAFNSQNAMDVAKLLQAALDLGNNPIILETGINKHTIGAANAMLYLGVPLEKVITTLRSDAIEKLVEEIDRNSSVFSGFENPIDIALGNKQSELSGVIETPISQNFFNNNSSSFTKIELAVKKNSRKNKNPITLLKVNEFYQTKALTNEDGTQESPIQFTVKLDESNKKVISVEPSNIKDESKRDQYELMKSFIEFNKISNEINSILPVIQRDNSMPNNSSELRKTKNAFNKLTKTSLIDFSPLTGRPLIGHYEKVVDLMINLQEEHFATEKGSYDQSENNMIDQIDKSIQKFGSKIDKRNKVVDIFQKMIAQGNLQVSSPTEFVKQLPEKIESILAYQQSGKYESSNPSIDNILQYTEGSQQYAEAVEQYKRMANSKEEEAIVLEKIKKAKEEKRYIEENSIIKDNKFFQNIKVSETKTAPFVKTIVPTDNYRKISQSEKEAIREDFNKIKDTSIGQDIIRYQMLRNGVSDKIGSLIDLMPNSYSVLFLKKMSAIKDSNTNQPRFKEAYRLNALLALENEIPKAVIINNYYMNSGWLRNENNEIIKVPKKINNSYVSKNEIVPKIKSTQFVNNSDYNFIKFDPSATTKESSTKPLNEC